MKICVSCNIRKSKIDFYDADKKCKECRKALVKKYRAKNLEKIREYDQSRANLPHRVAAREAYKKTERGIERGNFGKYAWIDRNREKRDAHIIVGNALRHGKLIRQPCACGNPKSEAHHEDYSKPLEVVWLCRRCHIDLHKEAAE
jgi:hypothetical protein